MIMGSIARRYAKALFGLAVEQARVEPWCETPPVPQPGGRGLARPPRRARRTRSTRRSSGARSWRSSRPRSGSTREPANLLFLLGDRNRLGYLGAIVGHVPRARRRSSSAALRAKVTSAVPLDAAAAQAIADRLSQATKATGPARPRGRSRPARRRRRPGRQPRLRRLGPHAARGPPPRRSSSSRPSTVSSHLLRRAHRWKSAPTRSAASSASRSRTTARRSTSPRPAPCSQPGRRHRPHLRPRGRRRRRAARVPARHAAASC